MPLPLSERQARKATRWLVTHFGDALAHAVEGTPFSVELLCGIACQETAFLWLGWIDKGLGAGEILARAIGDASGDAPNTTRNAFPRTTAAFRTQYDDAFADLLVSEANASRTLRGFGPKPWIYKGYGVFQYDLQHVRTDEAFFRERQWHEIEACLSRVLAELRRKFQATGEIWAAVKAYNGSGPRATEYRENVRTFTDWARDEIGRLRALPPEARADAPPVSAGRRRGHRAGGTSRARRSGETTRLTLPAARPRLSAADVRARIAAYGVDRRVHPVVVVGVRGYYRDTVGAPGVNDRGLYDDALFLDAPDAFASFNGNTDPSVARPGTGTGAAKGIASLNPGVWYVHRFDLHKGDYLALCQRLGQVTVTRDGTPPYPDTGMFGINIHRGGYNSTSSEGCQTIHPDQWPAFVAMAQDQARRWHGDRWNQAVIPYVLLA